LDLHRRLLRRPRRTSALRCLQVRRVGTAGTHWKFISEGTTTLSGLYYKSMKILMCDPCIINVSRSINYKDIMIINDTFGVVIMMLQLGALLTYDSRSIIYDRCMNTGHSMMTLSIMGLYDTWTYFRTWMYFECTLTSIISGHNYFVKTHCGDHFTIFSCWGWVQVILS
jgi:hypothetical protein